MNRNSRITVVSLVAFVSVLWAMHGAGAAPPSGSAGNANAAPPDLQASGATTVAEARARARLLHEAMHATLHVVHLRYYREDEALPLPAHTLKSVFGEMERRQQVKLHWLAVDGQAMNSDHKPRDDFEKGAVKALAGGKNEFERVEDRVYRHVGAISLTAECLKCHVPDRTSLEDRSAGLVITMPIRER